MNTILSIDLDILFSPYVGIYDKIVYNDKPLEFLWDSIEKTYNIWDFRINEKYYDNIKKILNNYISQVSTIYIGNDHSSILNAIELEKENFQLPYQFDIYNIDYHHDVVYNDNQWDKIIRSGISDCGCWIGYLSYYKFINKYFWYRGSGSEFNQDIMLNSDVISKMERFLLNDNFPLDLNIDLLFISISSPWIPNCYYSKIQDIILELPQEKIKYFQNPFFINENKPKFLFLKGDKFNDYFNFSKEKH